jgi:ATP-dependent Clp protease ATP-binding subunit ClpX
MDDVELEFTVDGLRETAVEAKRRGTGARGLRSIVEETLLDVMYDLPSMEIVKRCVIDGETITSDSQPSLQDAHGNIVTEDSTDQPAESENPAA